MNACERDTERKNEVKRDRFYLMCWTRISQNTELMFRPSRSFSAAEPVKEAGKDANENCLPICVTQETRRWLQFWRRCTDILML